MMNANYELVIGLEVHVELRTESKLFCACSTRFGAAPNSCCCPVCMGLPGALPTWNRAAVELAVKAGLSLGCRIREVSYAARKQYFYPDLPKGYQISQGESPLCEDGSVTIFSPLLGAEREIGIERIHIEEDAGKLIHKGDHTLIDGNRAGIALIEIVSRPELHSAKEASTYLRALREILVSVGVSDCKMQEGSMRCDVNLSVRKRGERTLGTRTEIKNLNSFSFVEKAIAHESARQIALLAAGEQVEMQTRRYDERSDTTVLMRKKESVDDYRFLEEPDLAPLCFSASAVEALRRALPELPRARRARLEKQYGISQKDALVLTADNALADYFEDAAGRTKHIRSLLGLLLTDLLRYCTGEEFVSPVPAERLAALATLLGEGSINSSTAKNLLSRLTEEDFCPMETVEREGLGQIRDVARLRQCVTEVLLEQPRAVEDYHRGKIAALQALLGRVMSKTKGRADPELSETLLREALAADRTEKEEHNVPI